MLQMHGQTFALNSFTFFLLYAAVAQDMGKVSHPPIFHPNFTVFFAYFAKILE
jgi:hypothetical protein